MKVLLPALLALASSLQLCADPGKCGHEELCERVMPAIVAIQSVAKPQPGKQTMSYFGTGTVISADGAVLTSTTVVPVDVDPKQVFVTMPGGKRVQATFVAASDALEVSLIRLPKGEYPFVQTGDSSKLKLGHVVYTFGNCYNSMERDDQVCVASGEVSGFYKIKDVFRNTGHYEGCTYLGEVIEVTAPLNPGVDGGPLVDAHGRVVGIMSLSYSEARYLGVAVPMKVAEEQVGRWLKGDLTLVEKPADPPVKPDVEEKPVEPPVEEPEDAGYLGATFHEENPVIAKLARNCPAAKAGLKVGDKILKIGATEIKNAGGLRKALRACKPGQEIVITYSRDGQTKTLKVTLSYQPM